MRRFLSSIATTTLALTGALLLASGCIVGTQVGSDGQGGSATATASSAAAAGGGCAGSIDPTGKSGDPCGGYALPAKPPCAKDLTCVQSNPALTGTCARPGTQLSGLGEGCGAFSMLAPICSWEFDCIRPPLTDPDHGGTCMPKSCSTSTGG